MTTISDFSSVAETTDRSREFILAVNWERAFVTVANAERFKQVSMFGLSAGKKKKAIVERWPLLEVRL